jgi:hypothetical protein
MDISVVPSLGRYTKVSVRKEARDQKLQDMQKTNKIAVATPSLLKII